MLNYTRGPWKNLLVGIFDDYPLRILLNEDGFLITEILNEDKTMAVVNIANIILVEGDAEAFIETMPKTNIFVMIHDSKSTNKFLMLTQKPQVIKADDSETKKFTEDQFKVLEKNTKIIKDIALSYDLKLTPFKEIPKEIKKTLFVNPSTFLSLIKATTEVKEIKPKPEPIKTNAKLINLGFFKSSNETAKEPLKALQKTNVIYGKNEDAKKQLIYILAEEYSLHNVNVLLFTYDENYQNIKYPNPEKEVKEKLNVEPIGFPITYFDNMHSDLSIIPKNALNELYNIQDVPAKLIAKVLEEKKPKTLQYLYELIGQTQPDDALFTKYNIFLTQRIVEIINQIHPKLYLGDYSTEPFTKVWQNRLGKINIVKLDKEDKIKSKVIVHNIFKKLEKEDKEIAVILPMASELMQREKLDSIGKELIEMIKESKNKYIFCFANTKLDLNEEIISNAIAEIQIIDNQDVAVKIKDSKPYRIILRPTLSKK